MRIRASSILLVGAAAGLTATAAIAAPKPAAPAAPACGCHAAPLAHHVRRHAVRSHVRVFRHTWKRVVSVGDERMHGGHDEHGWGEEHQWSEGGERIGYRYEQRPWATDQFGFLTWPGKTHFVPPNAAEGGPPPPPMDDNSMPPPPPPPPPGWRDGPSGPPDSAPQDQDGYDVYRF